MDYSQDIKGNIFNLLNIEKSKFNMETVKQIIEDIESAIKENVLSIRNTLNEDNENFLEKNEFSKLLDVIDDIKKEEYVLSKNSSKVIYAGIGNIGVFYNGRPDLFLYLAIKALKTNNNIVLFEKEEQYKTTELLKKIIKNVYEKNNYRLCIETAKLNQLSEVSGEISKFDLFVFINEQQKYRDFCAKNKNGVKTICSNYGTMDLFLADKQLENRLLEMDDYIYDNNIDLEIYKNDTVENVVKIINSRKNNYCAVIFTSDKKDAYYFIQNVNSKKVFVNKNPDKEYSFSIADEEFVMCKNVYI